MLSHVCNLGVWFNASKNKKRKIKTKNSLKKFDGFLSSKNG